jgi:hypothetical protein
MKMTRVKLPLCGAEPQLTGSHPEPHQGAELVRFGAAKKLKLWVRVRVPGALSEPV